ncbi:MAG: DUF4154 domain-containing protein [Phycisphaera sp.]|nr:DUF4154 domain-containing protein [Phycisphaera sp.]
MFLSTAHRAISATQRHGRRGRVWVVRLACAAAAVILAAGGPIEAATKAGDAKVNEAKAATVKAAYLRYLAEYVTWPDGAFADKDAPIVISVIGDDPHGVGATLDAAVRTKQLQAQGRPIRVLRLGYVPHGATGREAFVKGVTSSHLTFLTNAAGKAWPDLREMIGRRPIATTSEIDDFATNGGMVEFAAAPQEDDASKVSIVLRVNIGATREAQLKISARLLVLKNTVHIVDE